MTSTALVGPLPTVTFDDGTRVVYTVPRDTMDPRHAACTQHRVACDCREAERAEEISELRHMLAAVGHAANDILAGHQTWAWTETGRDRFAECKCTGCRIMRAADVGRRGASQVMREREAAGLAATIGGEA